MSFTTDRLLDVDSFDGSDLSVSGFGVSFNSSNFGLHFIILNATKILIFKYQKDENVKFYSFFRLSGII